MKFRLGQRVRIKKSATCRPEYEPYRGQVFTIIGLTHKKYDYTLNEFGPNKRPLGANECALIPIYDGDAPSTWAECMWKPVPLGKRKLETA